MARLLEDSDDEFPELAAVIGKYGSGTELKATGKNLRKVPNTEFERNQVVVKSIPVLQSDSSHTISDSSPPSERDVEKPKPRRRILKKKDDDPLLQAIDRQEESISSVTTLTTLALESGVLTTTPNAYTQSKETFHSSISPASEDEENYLAESTGLSDFIVNDSSLLDEESTDEEIQLLPPRSARRLVRGRRPPRPSSSEESYSKPVKDSQPGKRLVVSLRNSKPLEEGDDKEKTAQISNGLSPKVLSRGRCIITPPSSPQKPQKRLTSPNKGPRIPMTPHRPSMDAFWDPDVINEWNEEYSPRKPPKPQHQIGGNGPGICPPTSPKKTLLKKDPISLEAKKAFAQKKHDMAETFLRELDQIITDGKVSEMAALTGGVKITWNKKLQTTAGRAIWKRETVRSAAASAADNKLETGVTYRHHASIELAEKVIINEERLLNVIAHEFCHLANFMVSGVRNNPHGKEFKAWASRCSQRFGDRGVTVTTRHSYDIDYKYVWECSNCGTTFGRHSKSIDPARHQCKSCKTPLVQVKPEPRANAGVASEYQVFLKENMKKVKELNPTSPQKQIMTMVGKMYQEHKASKLVNLEGSSDGTNENDVRGVGSGEGSAKDELVNVVIRKLNFLDLTTP